MYAFAERYRRRDISAAELANHLYPPSYLSLQWALSYYGVIPERTVVLTSVSTRQTKRFQNDLGSFSYRHVKPTVFGGYLRVSIDGRTVLLAAPAKALVDLWYLEPGKWSLDRIREIRFQNIGFSL